MPAASATPRTAIAPRMYPSTRGLREDGLEDVRGIARVEARRLATEVLRMHFVKPGEPFRDPLGRDRQGSRRENLGGCARELGRKRDRRVLVEAQEGRDRPPVRAPAPFDEIAVSVEKEDRRRIMAFEDAKGRDGQLWSAEEPAD